MKVSRPSVDTATASLSPVMQVVLAGLRGMDNARTQSSLAALPPQARTTLIGLGLADAVYPRIPNGPVGLTQLGREVVRALSDEVPAALAGRPGTDVRGWFADIYEMLAAELADPVPVTLHARPDDPVPDAASVQQRFRLEPTHDVVIRDVVGRHLPVEAVEVVDLPVLKLTVDEHGVVAVEAEPNPEVAVVDRGDDTPIRAPHALNGVRTSSLLSRATDRLQMVTTPPGRVVGRGPSQ